MQTVSGGAVIEATQLEILSQQELSRFWCLGRTGPCGHQLPVNIKKQEGLEIDNVLEIRGKNKSKTFLVPPSYLSYTHGRLAMLENMKEGPQAQITSHVK